MKDLNTVDWDVVVIGGGASGLGCAIESASRGYKTLLLEKKDFAHATSSRSTKLIHGGVRYLEQGDVSLVKEALAERAYLLKEVPSIVQPLNIILPVETSLSLYYFRTGLLFYDLLAGTKGIQKSKILEKNELFENIPALNSKFRAAVEYMDAQFDDARLAIQLVKTIHDYGGMAKNYTEVKRINTQENRLFASSNQGQEYEISFKHLINAGGIFHDQICKMEDTTSTETMVLSRGSHLILKAEKFSQKKGMIIPKTSDGRVLFVLPWKDRILAGTTDILTDKPEDDPHAETSEIEFIKTTIEQFYEVSINSSDIISTFSGIRPLTSNGKQGKSSQISRSHVIRISKNGMVSISGGKWTTFRKMGEDCIDFLETRKHLPKSKSLQHHLKINKDISLSEKIEQLLLNRNSPIQEVKKRISELKNSEWAQTSEDILSRRVRLEWTHPDLAQYWKPMIEQELNRELMG